MTTSLRSAALLGWLLASTSAQGDEGRGDGSAPPSTPTGPRIVVINRSAQLLRELRFVRDGGEDYGDNVLGDGLKPGQRREVASPSGGSSGCTFDLRVKDDKGTPWVLQDALLCGAAAIEVLRDKGQLSYMVSTEVPPEATAKGGGAATPATGGNRPAPPAPAGDKGKGSPEPFVLANHAGLMFVELSLTSEGKEAQATRMDLPEGGVRDEGEVRLSPPTGRGCRYTLGLVDTGDREWTIKGVDLCGVARVELSRVGGGISVKRVPGR